ncbi:hypothetical protein, partial [Chimaeribacter arupi]|uniref:hypothetical protein n=1 Tax=Chimaeribacter arupi TaxID=2060066 RepID=UPI0019D4CB09
SVEQGIENPRVLGSIPSPGTTYSENPPYGGFLLFCIRTHHRTTFDDSGFALPPPGPARQARCATCLRHVVRVRAPSFKELVGFQKWFYAWAAAFAENRTV